MRVQGSIALGVACIVAGALVMAPGMAAAQTAPQPNPQSTGSANTDNGTLNYILQQSGQVNLPGASTVSTGGSGGSSGGASSCTTSPMGSLTQSFPPALFPGGIPQYYQITSPISTSVSGGGETGIPFIGPMPTLDANGNLPAGTTEYQLVCNGATTGIGFAGPGLPPAPAGAVPVSAPPNFQVIANQIAGSIPMPGVTINHSPNINGVVHLPTWFWASGYDGSPITVSKSAFGSTVAVKATPTTYTWDFGDGSSTFSTTSLGVPWPQTAGDITHTYNQLSTSGFPVSVTFNFTVSYQVNGGPVQPLPPIQRSAGLGFKVGEINTVVVSR